MGRLNQCQRAEAIGMLRAGWTITTIARHFQCSRYTVYNLKRYYEQKGDRGGRRYWRQDKLRTLWRHTTGIHERWQPLLLELWGVITGECCFVFFSIAQGSEVTSTAVSDFHFLPFRRFVNPETIRRILKSSLIRCRHPYKGLMTQRHRAGRLTWARAHARWTRQWGTVLFSDESKFNVSFADGRLWVWQQTG